MFEEEDPPINKPIKELSEDERGVFIRSSDIQDDEGNPILQLGIVNPRIVDDDKTGLSAAVADLPIEDLIHVSAMILSALNQAIGNDPVD